MVIVLSRLFHKCIFNSFFFSENKKKMENMSISLFKYNRVCANIRLGETVWKKKGENLHGAKITMNTVLHFADHARFWPLDYREFKICQIVSKYLKLLDSWSTRTNDQHKHWLSPSSVWCIIFWNTCYKCLQKTTPYFLPSTTFKSTLSYFLSTSQC